MQSPTTKWIIVVLFFITAIAMQVLLIAHIYIVIFSGNFNYIVCSSSRCRYGETGQLPVAQMMDYPVPGYDADGWLLRCTLKQVVPHSDPAWYRGLIAPCPSPAAPICGLCDLWRRNASGGQATVPYEGERCPWFLHLLQGETRPLF